MNDYTIRPLLLSKRNAEMGPMTYLAYLDRPVVRPYVMWYIKAGDKHVLVDTSMEAHDLRNYHPGFSNIPQEHVQSFEQALSSVDCEPEDIDIIIHTHLHMDHIYNTPKCKNAVVYIQKKELESALDPHPIHEIYFPRDIIEKIDFQIIDEDSVILPGISVVRTPGHTPGGQSVVVNTAKGRAVITGFCCVMDNFNPPEDVKTRFSPTISYPVIAPGIHTDLYQSFDSVLKVKEIADIIIPAHDPDMALLDRIP